MYSVQTQPNFRVQSFPPAPTLITFSILFTFNGSEFKIKPMNKNNCGFFTVTPSGGPTQSVTFTCSAPFKHVIGNVTFDGIVIEPQPDPSVFTFTLTGLTGAPFVGSALYMCSTNPNAF